MSNPIIGFIGLGAMGKPMARNPLKAGYPLIVHNRSRGSVDELSNEGAQPAASPQEVAERSETIISVLPDSPDVELVYIGNQGVFSGLKPGMLLIDMSSISPVVARRCQRRRRNVAVSGFAQSKILEVHGQKMLERSFKPGFRMRLHGKDMKIALAAGSEYGVPPMVTSQVAQMMTAMRSTGNGDLDHSGLVKFLEELAKMPLVNEG